MTGESTPPHVCSLELETYLGCPFLSFKASGDGIVQKDKGKAAVKDGAATKPSSGIPRLKRPFNAIHSPSQQSSQSFKRLSISYPRPMHPISKASLARAMAESDKNTGRSVRATLESWFSV